MYDSSVCLVLYTFYVCCSMSTDSTSCFCMFSLAITAGVEGRVDEGEEDEEGEEALTKVVTFGKFPVKKMY